MDETIDQAIARLKIKDPIAFSDPEIEKELRRNFFNAHEIEIAFSVIEYMMSKKLPLARRLEIARYNLNRENILFAWFNNFRFGKYKFVRATKKHLDTPFQFDIVNTKTNEVIANTNFYFVPPSITNPKSELHINSLQGVYKKDSELQELNEYLKKNFNTPNWRVFIVRELKKICNARGIKFIGQLPQQYFFIPKNATKKEIKELLDKYKRRLRQYIQAYLQGGIQIEDIRYGRVSMTHKEWVRENLRLKQERSEGSKPKKPKKRGIKIKKPLA